MRIAPVTLLIILPFATELFAASTPNGSFSIPLTKIDRSLKHSRKGHNLAPELLLATLKDRIATAGTKFANHFERARTNKTKTSKSSTMPKRSQGVVSMGDGANDFYYYGSVLIGTPPVSFNVILDTGSADLIVLSSPCIAGCDNTTQLYEPQDSATSNMSTTQFNIKYGIGNANGVLANDIVQIGEFKTNQTFAAIQSSSKVYRAGGSVTGVLGLAYQPIAASGAMPLIQQLYKSGQLDQPLFSMAFARQEKADISAGGLMNIGAINNDLFRGNITWSPSSARRYWDIKLDDIAIGSTSLGISTPSILVDSGTSLLYLGKAAATTFYSKIPGSISLGGGLFVYPCSLTVNVSITFNGVNWPISDNDFNAGFATTDGLLCVGAVAYYPGIDLWILGDVFLRNVYSIFRFEPPSIGFAALFNPDQLLRGNLPVANGTTLGRKLNLTSSSNNASPPKSIPFSAPSSLSLSSTSISAQSISTTATNTSSSSSSTKTASTSSSQSKVTTTARALIGADLYAYSLVCGFTSSKKGGDGTSPAEVEEEYKSALLYYKKIENYSSTSRDAYLAKFKCK